jgi:hypothetical protein
VEVEPGGMREIHWHPNADEMQYYISGQARMTVFAAAASAGTFDYQPGDVGFVPRNMGHYIENTGTTKLQFLELWKADKVADVSLRQWLAFTPFDLVRAHLRSTSRCWRTSRHARLRWCQHDPCRASGWRAALRASLAQVQKEQPEEAATPPKKMAPSGRKPARGAAKRKSGRSLSIRA